jgi:hypothetical protein
MMMAALRIEAMKCGGMAILSLCCCNSPLLLQAWQFQRQGQHCNSACAALSDILNFRISNCSMKSLVCYR